jgi:signal transduction histidine kinase
MMSATVMMTDEGPDWPHLKTVARILKSVTRMDSIIKDLLDFTRTRLGSGIPIVPAAMDMERVCHQTVDEITAFHPQCVVDFEAHGDLHGQWDSARIGQMILNLVGNAYQHGVEQAPIAVRLRGDPNKVVLTVQNQGQVIAKEHLRDIFDPFRQLEPSGARSRNPSSVGLGLYIVRAIVIAHHGTIEVASAKGGTTFTVRLPRKILLAAAKG